MNSSGDRPSINNAWSVGSASVSKMEHDEPVRRALLGSSVIAHAAHRRATPLALHAADVRLNGGRSIAQGHGLAIWAYMQQTWT
jgi:hypothetical protein